MTMGFGTRGAAGASSWAPPGLGLACAQGWLVLVAVCASAYWRVGDVGFVLGPLWPGYALGSLGMLAAQLGWRGRVGMRVSDVAGIAFALLGAMLVIVSHSMAELFVGAAAVPVALLAFLGCALMGVGSAVLCMLWWRRLAAAAGGSAACVVAASGVAALGTCVLVFPFSLLGHTVWAPLLNVALMLCSFAGLRLGGRAEAAPKAAGDDDADETGCLPVRALAGCGVLGLATALMLGQFVGAPFARALDETWAFGVAGALAASAAQLVARRVAGRWVPQVAGWAVAAALVVAFYPVNSGTEFSLEFAMAGTATGLGMALAAVPSILWELARTAGLDPARSWAQGTLALGAPVALAAPAGYAVAGMPFEGSFVFVSAIVAMIAGFVALALLMRPADGVAGPNASGHAPKGIEGDVQEHPAHGGVAEDEVALGRRCAALASSHGLTPRESETLLVLARGYDVARVQAELGVSEGTALTHKRHVYQKLGVHARSELLDLVREG